MAEFASGNTKLSLFWPNGEKYKTTGETREERPTGVASRRPQESPLTPAHGVQSRVAPTFVLKYNIRTRSLADQGAIEDILAVEDDVVPFDRADVLGAGLRQGLPW